MSKITGKLNVDVRLDPTGNPAVNQGGGRLRLRGEICTFDDNFASYLDPIPKPKEKVEVAQPQAAIEDKQARPGRRAGRPRKDAT